MRSGGSKSKGSSFERECCKKLSLWLTNGLREDTLWRSALSGGRATVGLQKGKSLGAQAGDISSVDPASATFIEKFYIECKFYRNLQFAGLLDGKGNLMKFWREAKRQSKQYGKLPMLIGKQNHYPAFIILGQSSLEEFSHTTPIIQAWAQDFNLWLFDDFLKHVRLK